MLALDPPPNGALVAGRIERAAWLGQVEIAYRLPREGLLYLPEGVSGPSVALTSTSLQARAGPSGPTRATTLGSTEHETLRGIWRAAWLSPLGTEASCLLHYRGILRTVAPPHDAALCGLIRLLIRHSEAHAP